MTEIEIAEAIRLFMIPYISVESIDISIEADSKKWASNHVNALRTLDIARYLEALTWFYAENSPTMRLERLKRAAEKALPMPAIKDLRKMLSDIE